MGYIVVEEAEYDRRERELEELRASSREYGRVYVHPISVDEDDYFRLLQELKHLRQQVSDLQAAGSALVQLKRDGDITYHVKNFHTKFGQPIRETPQIPGDEEVRFRAKLHAEEFFETMDAIFPSNVALGYVQFLINGIIERALIHVNLPELADGLCDMDYINAGTALTFGLPRVPILLEVQRSNMEKIYEQAGKPSKPPGWKPPDIRGVLMQHGWAG